MNNTRIIDFRPEHQPYFEKFNRAWIEKYFTMEQRDVWVLTQPYEMIIINGGAVLMAEYDGNIAGAVALLKTEEGIFEFTKMAVDENFRRRGIAEELTYASFRKAKDLGAKKLILYSNSILKPAIALYEKLGFKHVPLGNSGYKRSDVKMSIDIETAIQVSDRHYQLIQI